MKQEKLYKTIFKRKSIRKYDKTPLNNNILNNISDFISTLKPLYDNIKTQIEIVSGSEIKNLFPIKSPHYIVVSSESKDGYLTNVGFMLQQMDLFLSTNGIGSCWVGMAKPKKSIAKDMEYEFVITLAFGKPAEPLYRNGVSEFKRKSVKEISNVNKNDVIEAARLAPSGTNGQPWYFKLDDNFIHVYCVKPNIIKAFLYKNINKIDMGIAIYHLYIALKHFGKDIKFVNDKSGKAKVPPGYYYINTLEIK